MIETITENIKSYELDFMPTSGRKPIIYYTCVICRTNFLSIGEITTHNFEKHISLMRQRHLKILKLEQEMHTSWSYREKCRCRPMCQDQY